MTVHRPGWRSERRCGGFSDRFGALGRVDNPKPLTVYREDGPYVHAEYDMADMKTMAG